MQVWFYRGILSAFCALSSLTAFAGAPDFISRNQSATTDTFPLINIFPDSFPHLNPSSVLVETLTVQNAGSASLQVTSITRDSTSWLTINNGSGGFVIPAAGADVPVEFAVDDAGYADGVYVDTIVINNNSANNPSVKVVVRLIVDNAGGEFLLPEEDTLDNGVVKIAVTNFGNLGNQSIGFSYVAGSDTVISALLEATGFLAVINSAGDTVTGNSMHNRQTVWQLMGWSGVKDTTVISPVQKPGSKVKIPPGDYKFASASWAVFRPFDLGVEYPGPWYGFTITDEWWLPDTSNPAWSPKFLLWGQEIKRVAPPSWWPWILAIDSTLATVYLGTAADWNAFTTVSSSQGHTDHDNFGSVSPGTGVAWVQGSDTSDTHALDSIIQTNDHFAFTAWMDSLDNVDPFAMHLVSSPSYLNPGGYFADPMGAFRDNQLYQIASNPGASDTIYFHGEEFDPDFEPKDGYWPDEPTDINVIMTNAVLTSSYPTSTVAYNLLGIWFDTTGTGLVSEVKYADPNESCDQLENAIDQARVALGLGKLKYYPDASFLDCKVYCACAMAGDANADNMITLADVIATVNYVFNRSGWPACFSNNKNCWLSELLCRGDWNASSSVTLSDVIQGVNYLFNKPGGPWCALSSGYCCGYFCD